MPLNIINMIPNSLSGETNRDSEPNVSVNPANPLQIAASAFTPDPANSGTGPIFVSTDGGNTWTLNVVLPGGNRTGDTSLRFATTSNVLYAGILRSDNANMNILRKANFTAAGAMTVLVNRANEDQPWVEAATVLGGQGVGLDRVYVGHNDFNAAAGRTASVELSLDAATAPAPAGFVTARIDVRATSGQDGPPIRNAWHPNGTVYGVFLGWRGSGAGGTITSDVVVVRDDDWGAGATPFRDLVDGGDGQAGVRVVTGTTLPPFAALLGTQRTGASVAIAVDPRSSRTVYIAWIDGNSGATATLHVRRSNDAGQTWSADLRTIATATNPCLAINVQGRVGFMYQQLENPGSGNRWRTHLELSDDGFATAPTDLLLADVPDANGSYTGANPIGDYANLIAVGKNFYGTFCGNNTPANANFPNGVTYQRNANFGTNTLLANDGVTPVAVSIDPFFFRFTDLGAADDLYVRDWTDSAAVHDTGLEPSTHAVFYATSDVWNQRTNVAPTFVSDQPQNQDPQNDATNFAFARISRNGTGIAETVNVEFLVAEFGTGSPYASVATTSVNFAAGDSSKIASASWVLGPTSSTHLCLAVQISTTNDPFIPPGLNGNTPGWPTTDLIVINDNNKAQRNMSVHFGLSGFGSAHYGIVFNASKKVRDFVLRIRVADEVLRGFKKPTVGAQGLDKSIPLKSGATLTMKGMRPGEYRWVAFDMAAFEAATGTSLPVDFEELVGDKVVNGFRFNIAAAKTPVAVRELLLFTAAVFRRLLAQFKIEAAAPVVKSCLQALKGGTLTLAAYRKLMVGEQDEVTKSVEQFLATSKGDGSLDIGGSLKALLKALGGASDGDTFARHVTLLNKLDVAITLDQKMH
jgi:hypothetical protein